jgi:hypothetical protein
MLEVTRQIRQRSPGTEVIIFTMHDNNNLIHDLPCLASASSNAAMQNDASIVIDTRHDSTRRENQSSNLKITRLIAHSPRGCSASSGCGPALPASPHST